MVEPTNHQPTSKDDRPTILVVEDNPVERQLVSKILRNADFDVIAVDCGEVVVRTINDYQPDLVLLDALLPDIDGFDVEVFTFAALTKALQPEINWFVMCHR